MSRVAVANTVVLTVEEAAAHLRLPDETIAREASRGNIPGRQVDGQWRFLRSALDEWLALRDGRRILLAQAGALTDDESLGELRDAAYRNRGRPEADSDPAR